MMSTTNQNHLVEAWLTLGPWSRKALQVGAAVGGISILYNLGYCTFKGLGILTMVCLAVALIVMSVSGAELSTRQAVTDQFQAVWDLVKAGFVQVMTAGQQAKQQATA